MLVCKGMLHRLVESHVMGVGYSNNAYWLGNKQRHGKVFAQILIRNKRHDYGCEYLTHANTVVAIRYQRPFEELLEVRAPSGVIVHDLLDPGMLPNNVGRVYL